MVNLTYSVSAVSVETTKYHRCHGSYHGLLCDDAREPQGMCIAMARILNCRKSVDKGLL